MGHGMTAHDEGMEQQYWSAVVGRDRAFDGRFFYGVLTTGVYCRPSCGARIPLRKNVRFYPTAADAERVRRKELIENRLCSRHLGLVREVTDGR